MSKQRTLGAVCALIIGIAALSGCGARSGGERQTAAAAPHLVTYTVEATEFRFSPSLLTVHKGTQVTIRFVNKGKERHEWEIEAFDLEIKPIEPGQTGEITFVADKPGTYEFICDLEGHHEAGMRGFLIVTDPS